MLARVPVPVPVPVRVRVLARVWVQARARALARVWVQARVQVRARVWVQARVQVRARVWVQARALARVWVWVQARALARVWVWVQARAAHLGTMPHAASPNMSRKLRTSVVLRLTCEQHKGNCRYAPHDREGERREAQPGAVLAPCCDSTSAQAQYQAAAPV